MRNRFNRPSTRRVPDDIRAEEQWHVKELKDWLTD